MNAISQRKRSLGLSVMLVLFALVYVPGIIYLLLGWVGVQSFDPGIWQHGSLPFYALAFGIAAVGAYGILKWKKWGTYCLSGAWVFTGILNSIFIPPTQLPYRFTFLAVLLVIAFFLFLLPAWQNME